MGNKKSNYHHDNRQQEQENSTTTNAASLPPLMEIKGYRCLQFHVGDKDFPTTLGATVGRGRVPDGLEMIISSSIVDYYREECCSTFCGITTGGRADLLGIKPNDILLVYQEGWKFGVVEHIKAKLAEKRAFSLHVLRKETAQINNDQKGSQDDDHSKATPGRNTTTTTTIPCKKERDQEESISQTAMQKTPVAVVSPDLICSEPTLSFKRQLDEAASSPAKKRQRQADKCSVAAAESETRLVHNDKLETNESKGDDEQSREQMQNDMASTDDATETASENKHNKSKVSEQGQVLDDNDESNSVEQKDEQDKDGTQTSGDKQQQKETAAVSASVSPLPKAGDLPEEKDSNEQFLVPHDLDGVIRILLQHGGQLSNEGVFQGRLVELLDQKEAVQRFVLAGGNRDAVALLDKECIRIQCFGWMILAANFLHEIFPDEVVGQVLCDRGICHYMVLSLQKCDAPKHFDYLMKMCGLLLTKSKVLLERFSYTENAVFELVAAANRFLTSKPVAASEKSFTTCFDLLKRSTEFLTDPEMLAIIENHGLTMIGQAKWHFKGSPELQAAAEKAVLSLL